MHEYKVVTDRPGLLKCID